MQFRNYSDVSVAFDPVCNVICGENGQGKTNLLEAVVYLSCGRSPRTHTEREMLQFGCREASLRGLVAAHGRDFQIDIALAEGKRKKISINRVPAKRASDLSEIFGTVFFCPDDLQLIRAGAAARRKFMDTSLCQLRPRYAAALAEYARLYEHKTRILRDSEENPQLLKTLPDFNERMAVQGAILIYYRARYSERLQEYAARAHRECSGGREELAISYETVKTVVDPFVSAGEIAEQLRIHQKNHEQAELASRLCLSGPHKDDLSIAIGGRDARQFASQGQARTAALSLKLAERDIFREITGETPILLLDDVLSELDVHRQEFVLNRISGGQVFISCCEEDRLSTLLGGKVFRVREGTVESCICTSETT